MAWMASALAQSRSVSVLCKIANISRRNSKGTLQRIHMSLCCLYLLKTLIKLCDHEPLQASPRYHLCNPSDNHAICHEKWQLLPLISCFNIIETKRHDFLFQLALVFKEYRDNKAHYFLSRYNQLYSILCLAVTPLVLYLILETS